MLCAMSSGLLLLRAVALKLSDVHANCLVSFGIGTMVPTNIESLYPCTNILLTANIVLSDRV